MSNNFFRTSSAAQTSTATSDVKPAVPASAIPADVDANGDAKSTSTGNSDENNTVETLISNLTIGKEAGIVSSSPDQQQQTQQQAPQTPEQATAAAEAEVKTILESFNAPFKGDNLTAEMDINAIAEGISRADLTPLQTSLEALGQGIVERANRILLAAIPDIIDASKASALAEVNAGKSVDTLWNRFATEHTELSTNRKLIEPMLVNAVKDGASEEDAFAAIATIYGGLVKKSAKEETTGPDPRSPLSKTFDLANFASGQ